MIRLRVMIAVAVLAMAVTAQQAFAQSAAPPTLSQEEPTTDPTVPPATGVTVTPTPAPAPPPPPAPAPPKPGGKGGKQGGSGGSDGPSKGGDKTSGEAEKEGKQGAGKDQGRDGKDGKKGKDGKDGAVAAPGGSTFGNLTAPLYPSVSCGPAGAPAELLPIYQRAADAYNLGPQGPSILAAINGIESAFGANMGPSSAGAVGWMQFMPSTWEAYGVDADGDGDADPYDPQDAIFSAANYLSASGMPADTPGAIFAYNHADWYVADVLAQAGCYGSFDGTFSLTSGMQVIACTPADDVKMPERYLHAFERAAGRYDLGRRGVWALAAVARLESDYGRGMGKKQMRSRGPLGLDRDEWNRFEVDGDGDGRIRHASIDDSAATLARLIWSRDDLRAGVFLHNQASWYVEQVVAQADRLSGRCETRSTEWNVALPEATSAPINWSNLILTNSTQMRDIQAGALDPRVVGLIGAITQTHQIQISSLRSDHSKTTVEGYVSNHYFGRAIDISAVDGVPCTDTAPGSPCAVLGRTLTLLPAPSHPTELIYCSDLDGPGPAFARADHCDHLHVGYDG